MLGSALLLLAVLGGPTDAPVQSAPIKAGIYDLEVTYGGGVVEGTLELEIKGDSIEAKLSVGGHSPPIRSITRIGSRLKLVGGVEGMVMEYDLTFSGDAVSGVFNFNGTDGTLTGKRRKSQAG